MERADKSGGAEVIGDASAFFLLHPSLPMFGRLNILSETLFFMSALNNKIPLPIV